MKVNLTGIINEEGKLSFTTILKDKKAKEFVKDVKRSEYLLVSGHKKLFLNKTFPVKEVKTSKSGNETVIKVVTKVKHKSKHGSLNPEAKIQPGTIYNRSKQKIMNNPFISIGVGIVVVAGLWYLIKG